MLIVASSGSFLACGSVPPAQCETGTTKDRGIEHLETLRRETGAWATDVNERQRGVDWHMTVAAARRKLKSVYPDIKI